MNTNARILQVILLIAGVSGLAALGPALKKDGKLDRDPNVLHLKRSPFGRTLALAMRGPVDVYWHRGEVHEHAHEDGEECAECGHDHDHEGHHHPEADDPDGDLAALAAMFELEEPDHDGHEHAHQPEAAAPAKPSGLRPFLLDRIDSMRNAYYSRSNTRAESPLHKAYIMSETERRLSLSYQLDPTNNVGYGAYFLFLSEALARVEGEKREEGVIVVRQQAALNLANYTVQYCLNFQDEAPAMLTAANASHDYLQVLLTQPNPNLKVAAEFLRILDGSLQRYELIRSEMMAHNTWNNFSLARRTEMEDSYKLVRMLRDADHKILSQRSNTAALAPDEPSS